LQTNAPSGLPRRIRRYQEKLTPDFGYWIEAAPVLDTVQTPYQTMQIVYSKTFGNILRLDGAFQYSDADECFYHEPLVHMALTHHAQPLDVVIIGGGDGGAARQVLKSRTVKTVTHVEIDQQVVQAAERFLAPCAGRDETRSDRSAALCDDIRYNLQIGNGLDYLCGRVAAIERGQALTCDVLILDLTDQGGPSEPLYTAKFLGQCKKIIGQQGVLTLHLAAPWFQTERCRELVSLLRETFDQVVPFITCVPISGGQWLMAICGAELARLDVAQDEMVRRLGQLSGSRLKVINADVLSAMKVLPPYLVEALSEELMQPCD
jgi:spermidine synthase